MALSRRSPRGPTHQAKSDIHSPDPLPTRGASFALAWPQFAAAPVSSGRERASHRPRRQGHEKSAGAKTDGRAHERLSAGRTPMRLTPSSAPPARPLALQQRTSRGGPTLGQGISGALAPEHASTLAQSTRERYAGAYNVHIAPWLDDLPLRELTVLGCVPGRASKSRPVSGRARSTSAAPFSRASFVTPPRARRYPPTPSRWYGRRSRASGCGRAAGSCDGRADPFRDARSTSTGRRGRPVGQRHRRRYELDPPGEPATWQRDALITSLLAYSDPPRRAAGAAVD